MADRYYRLITLVVDVCTPVLRELLLFYAKADTSTQFINIQQYMSAKEPNVRQLRGLPKHIYEKIYNSGPIDESKWDITCITCLLLGIFTLPIHIKSNVEQIRTERNKLQHIKQLQSLSEQEYESTWGSIEQSIRQLVSNLSPGCQQQTAENINNARIGNFPNMCNTFTTWCLSLAGDLEEVKENTHVTRRIVENVTEKRVDSRGIVVKRFKAVDDILRRMKECFDSTMSRELPDDFKPPDCIAQIRDYLRQKRHVIVTGTVGRSYLQVALAAIKEINTEPNVSAEISLPSDWRHIDPSEIKFILSKNPFGDDLFDAQKARAMVDVLCPIINSAYAGELTLAIVTKKDVLVQAQDVFGKDHDVLQNIVELYAETTMNNPEMIVSRPTTSCCPNCQRMPHSALQVMSSCYLAQTEELPLKKSVFEEAKSTLKKERVVVLVGRNERLIRSCIKQLAEQFAPNNCLVMSNPDDIKHLDTGAAMAVFLNITGQFTFDMSKSRRWFEYFDFIHALVKSNKLRVVLTFEQSALTRCITKINDHELLKHKVTIAFRDVEEIQVKREATAEDELPPPGTSFPGEQDDSDVPCTASHLTDIILPWKSDYRILTYITLLSFNRLLMTGKDIMLLNLQTQSLTSSLSFQDYYCRATRVSDTRAAICHDAHTIKFILVSVTDQMSWDGEINVGGVYTDVVCVGDRLFVSLESGSETTLLDESHGIRDVRGLAYCSTEDKVYVLL
ncbi:hypothetical protein MAR_032849 [Mya arenaria]|uniref:Novel STAND NTPase 3 domain-containing protein n=1 Tax=Mya arenaria TaxID=6604 RepID=A0ABY7G7A4_MYAAR|nr:hypothetical protein MAR_032849 [Mya arenaria]